MSYEKIWKNIFDAVHNWKNYSEKVEIAGGSLEVSFWCSKNYEGLPFQKLDIAFCPPDLVYREDRKTWYKEGTGKEHIIKDAVLDRLKESIWKFLEKQGK